MTKRDPEVFALQAACKAIERSGSTRMIVANLRFMWDRYVMHPPARAWWVSAAATNPARKK